MSLKQALAGMLLVAVTVSCAHRSTDTVLILHTNDIHGHIREGADGVGGMARVGGYIRQVTAKRPDTLLLDGGDVNNKGDMLPGVTKGRALYQIMGMIGYDATVPGNHEFYYGSAHTVDLAQGATFPSLCLNAFDESGKPLLSGSQIFDVDGMKVGVIGLTVKRSEETLTLEDSCPLLAREAERLEPDVHLLVALCHLSSRDCATVSRAVPAIDVFIGGHSHEKLFKPVVVKETGAVIIEAGACSQYVGRLKVKVDLDTEEVLAHKGKLVPMRSKYADSDAELRDWIAQQERLICPEVDETVGTCRQEVSRRSMARLLAEALFDTGEADVALARTGTFCRGLPEGTITYNTLYRTLRLGEQPPVVVELSGREILFYLEQTPKAVDISQWAGFTVDIAVENAKESGTVVTSDLAPDHVYRVIMPEDEAREMLPCIGAEGRELRPCAFTLSETLLPYAARLGQGSDTLDAMAVPKPELPPKSAG